MQDQIVSVVGNCALIIGYGSIGRRHAGILKDLGFKVIIYSRHLEANSNVFSDLTQALQQQPKAVAICSETFLHGEHFSAVIKACPKAKILIEKPLGFIPDNIEHIINVAVGYNLRFHPQIKALKPWLQGHKIYHASLSIQRHLPTMRKNADYTKSYSCFKAQGGGVLNDFSHDLDLALMLFGPCRSVKAHGGKFGDLHGDSDDHFVLLMECENCPSVVINMSYLNPKPERKIQVVCEHGVANLDLDNNTGLVESNLSGTEAMQLTYIEQWHALVGGRSSGILCHFKAGVEVEGLISKCDESNNKNL
jgi:predicted dehydrogenase